MCVGLFVPQLIHSSCPLGKDVPGPRAAVGRDGRVARLGLATRRVPRQHPQTFAQVPLARARAPPLFTLHIPRSPFPPSASFSAEGMSHGFIPCDPLAALVLLDKAAVRCASLRHMRVELGGALTRGQTVVDWGRLSGGLANCFVVTAVDLGVLRARLAAALR